MSAVAAAKPDDGERVAALPPPPRFEDVYAEQFTMVWRLVSHRVPASALDDVVQEVFIVVHRKLPEFQSRSTIRTWVYGIVRLVIRDYLRNHGNRPAGEALAHEPVCEAELPSDLLARKEALSVLDEALLRMTEEQREAFLLMDVEQMTSREVAESLGVNDNTVRTRVRAARGIFEAAVTRFRARQRWGGTDHG